MSLHDGFVLKLVLWSINVMYASFLAGMLIRSASWRLAAKTGAPELAPKNGGSRNGAPSWPRKAGAPEMAPELAPFGVPRAVKLHEIYLFHVYTIYISIYEK